MAVFDFKPSEVTPDMILKYGWWLKHQEDDEIIAKLNLALQFLPKARKDSILQKLLDTNQ